MIQGLLFVFFIIISCIGLGLLLPSIMYIKKYKKEEVKIKLFIPIIGMLIGAFLLLIPIYFITFFLLGFPREIAWTKYQTMNGVMEIGNTIKIEQSVDAGIATTKTRYGFLKSYEFGYPYTYHMEFNIIFEQINKIKFNSLLLCVNEIAQEIINIDNISDIKISVMREHSGWGNNEEKNISFIKMRGIIFEENYNDKLGEFTFMYDLPFDFELIENFTVIYDIDIELGNGELINIEGKTNFNKEYLIEKTTEVKPILKGIFK
jgi:hypothetical protein